MRQNEEGLFKEVLEGEIETVLRMKCLFQLSSSQESLIKSSRKIFCDFLSSQIRNWLFNIEQLEGKALLFNVIVEDLIKDTL